MKDLKNNVEKALKNENLKLVEIDSNGVAYVEPVSGYNLNMAMNESQALASRVKEITAVVLQTTSGEYVLTSDMTYEESMNIGRHYALAEAYAGLGEAGMLEVFSDPEVMQILKRYQGVKTKEEKEQCEAELAEKIHKIYARMKKQSIADGKARLEKAIERNAKQFE